MTTTEFIKLIKACKEGRNKMHGLNWESSDPAYIISESELDKIEKVNVELLEALQNLVNYKNIFEGYLIANKSEQANGISPFIKAEKAIKNANNIKQI